MTFGGFDTVETVEVEPAKAKRNRKARPEREMPGVEMLAVIDTIVESLTKTRDEYLTQVTKAMTDVMVPEGMAAKDRPQNFIGLDGEAKASCELAVRANSKELNEVELKLLRDKGLPIRTTGGEQMLFIKKEYLADQEMMAKVETALKGVEGLPADFIQSVMPPTKHYVGTDIIKALFARRFSEKTIREVLPVISTLCVKAEFVEENNLARAFAILEEMIPSLVTPETEGEAA